MTSDLTGMRREFLVELGVDIWVGWQPLKGAALSNLEDYIPVYEDVQLGQVSISVDSPIRTSQRAVLSANEPLAEMVKLKSDVKRTAFPIVELAAGKIIDPKVAIEEEIESKHNKAGDDSGRDFEGSFLIYCQENYLVLADAIESHLFATAMSLLGEVLSILPENTFNKDKAVSFNWPPFNSRGLPGQDMDFACDVLVSLLGENDLDMNKYKHLIYFGQNIGRFLALADCAYGVKNGEGDNISANWLLLPSLLDLMESGEVKRQAWKMIKSKYFDRLSLDQ